MEKNADCSYVLTLKNVLSLELSQELLKNGFIKRTVFEWYERDIYNMAFEIKKWSVKGTNDFDYAQNIFFVPAPTLGEIELPEGIAIYKKKGYYHIAVHDYVEYVESGSYTIQTSCYPTELEARAHAWLWAKQKEKGVQND